MKNLKFLSLKECCDILGVHIMTGYRLVYEDKLPVFKVRGHYRIAEATLETGLQNNN